MDTAAAADMEDFCKRLPKVELHAHLTGSISRQCLHQIWSKRKKLHDPEFSLDDPLAVIPADGITDVKTFFPLFSKYIYHLCGDVEAVAFSTTSVLQDFADDGVVYLELRTTPRHNPLTGMTKEAYVETVLDTIARFEYQQQANGTGDGNHGNNGGMQTKLILSVDRRDSIETATQTLELALRYKDRGVVGLDLCGDPLKGDVTLFRPAFLRAKAAGGLGITLHFAEVPQSSTNQELQMLLSFQPDRLGHVIHVPAHIKQQIQQRGAGLTLELCISCNVQAGLDPKVVAHRDHHFGEWWNERGQLTNPLAICTDDVGIFGSSCSNEYALVAKHFGLDRKELWELASGAVAAIFAGERMKEKLVEIFTRWRVAEGF